MGATNLCKELKIKSDAGRTNWQRLFEPYDFFKSYRKLPPGLRNPKSPSSPNFGMPRTALADQAVINYNMVRYMPLTQGRHCKERCILGSSSNGRDRTKFAACPCPHSSTAGALLSGCSLLSYAQLHRGVWTCTLQALTSSLCAPQEGPMLCWVCKKAAGL